MQKSSVNLRNQQAPAIALQRSGVRFPSAPPNHRPLASKAIRKSLKNNDFGLNACPIASMGARWYPIKVGIFVGTTSMPTNQIPTPGELRAAECDLDAAVWPIPGEKMKMK